MSDRYDFFEDRATYVREQLKEKIDGAAWTNKDISSSSLKVYLRIFTQREEAATIDLLMTKVVGTSSPGDTGIVEGYPKPTSGLGNVVCRMVFVDEGTVDAVTITGYREIVWLEWEDYVQQSPQA